MSVEAIREFEDKFHATILDVYGLTESTGLVTANPVYGVRKPGSIGIAVSGVEIRLVDKSGAEVDEVAHDLEDVARRLAGRWSEATT